MIVSPKLLTVQAPFRTAPDAAPVNNTNTANFVAQETAYEKSGAL